jgi:hypothetical protein
MMNLASDFSFDGAQLNASLLALDAVAHEPVQLKLLAWVMGLPNGLDPAIAARIVMKQHDARISTPLMKLVEVVAQYPRERLAQMARRRRTLN